MIISVNDTPAFIFEIRTALAHGNVVAVPTDTVYGLVCDSSNKNALEKLIALKGRAHKPFAFFISKQRYEDFVQVVKKKIIEYFIPGPITIILRKQPSVSLPLIEDKIGIRTPQNNSLIQLLSAYEQPLCATSANRSGEKPLTSAAAIAHEFGDQLLIIDGGKLGVEPSTVIDLTTTPPTLCRKGVVPILEIEKVYGRPVLLDPLLSFNVLFVCSGNTCRSPMAAGILTAIVGDERCHIRSAGTLPVGGSPASQYSAEVVREYGGSIDEHVSQSLTQDLIAWADVIFVMAYTHYHETISLTPQAAVKTFLLKEYKRKVKYNEIADPVGKDKKAYEQTAQEMMPSLKLIARDIKKRLPERNRQGQ
jgi:tRNA threonylcarbamoyl adenosine modification protein (Sua5/YciO/YrdC/YwlC family)